MMDEISLRRSSPVLVDPAPSSEEIKQLLRAAQQAPDHGRLRPWKYIVVKGEGRVALGELYLKSALVENAALATERQERIKRMPLRAPLIIIAVAQVLEGHKVPILEQVVATGAAVQNMLLMAQSLRYGAMWRTGDMAYSVTVKKGLGLRPEDVIVAYLYLGTAGTEAKPRADEDYEACCSQWWGEASV
ncbi:MAG: nitroreductase [Gammaproteobacteria bacterium]|nr:nitroreductase [Gammaproteobacteria bacterium]